MTAPPAAPTPSDSTRPVRRLAGLPLVAIAAAALSGCAGASNTPAPAPGSAAPQASTSVTATDSNVAGDIPDTQPFAAVTSPDGTFTVKVPDGWARTAGGGAVVYSDHANAVRLETIAAAQQVTASDAQQREVPAIARGSGHVAEVSVTTVQRRGGDAVLITYKVDSAPDPVTGKVVRLAVERYEFWRSGKEAIVTLSGPVGADNVDPWRTVTDSFAWR